MALTCKMKTHRAAINTSQLGAASTLDPTGAACTLTRADARALTEVVVVFWLPGVADLLDVDVGGAGWNPHHSVVTWRRRKTSGESAGEPSTMTAAERSHLQAANSFTMPAAKPLGDLQQSN